MWERQINESARDFDLFRAYRDMGTARSHSKVAEQVGMTTMSVSQVASRRNWTERIRRFEMWQDQLYQDTLRQETLDMARRHAVEAQKTLDALMAPIRALQDRINENPELVQAELEDKDIKVLMGMVQQSARVMPSTMNAERLARGLPTEITQTEGTIHHEVDHGNTERLTDIILALKAADLLDGPAPARDVGEIIDAEGYEVDPGDPPPQTDSLPARTSD